MIKKLTLITILFASALPFIASAAVWKSHIQAWIYPGSPACNAMTEIADGRVIDTLKPQYYAIWDDGTIHQDTVASNGCNGYSAANAALIKQYSNHQYVTVSGSLPGWPLMAASASLTATVTSTLTTFVVNNGFTGVELDFEGYSSWTAQNYADYKSFLTSLGASLHAQGKKLMVDGPALRSQGTQAYKYEQIEPLVDYQVPLTYDFQFDFGIGTDVSPSSTIRQAISFILSKVTNSSTVVFGMPSYGYRGSGGAITIETQAQSFAHTGSSTAVRDSSWENFWTNSTTTYDYQDSSGMDSKRTDLESNGAQGVSVWHLGGNAWFTNANTEPSGSTPPPTTAGTSTILQVVGKLSIVGTLKIQ